MSDVELKPARGKSADVAAQPVSRKANKRRFRIFPVLITLAAVAIAAGLSRAMWNAYMVAPWTRDGYGVGSGVGLGEGVGAGSGAAVGLGASLGVGVSVGLGAGSGVGLGAGSGVALAVGVAIGADVGVGFAVGPGVGATVWFVVGAAAPPEGLRERFAV